VTLDLAENRLEQSTIPSFMYELTELQLLAFENNQFSGTISATIRGLSQLTYLSLFNNQLSGTLPSTIGLLSKLGKWCWRFGDDDPFCFE
jgi:Leucine-rich repeat (LRR) protein